MGSKYPRHCRNGHYVNGPADEYSNGTTGRRKCKACVNAYHQTPRCRELMREHTAKYEATTKGMVNRIHCDLRKALRQLETHEEEN